MRETAGVRGMATSSCQLLHLSTAVTVTGGRPNARFRAQQDRKGTVALRDRWSCWIVGGGGVIQITSWSSSNAVASWNTDATSTPSS